MSMITRRKSKAAPESEPPTLAVELPDDITLPEDITFSSPLTADDVIALCRALQEKAEDAERKDVELDQALQDREGVTAKLEEAKEQVSKLEKERDELVSNQTLLNTKIASLTTYQNSSSVEVEDVKRQLADSEREKRDLLGVVSRLKEESSQRDEEINTLRASLKTSRQELQSLEGQVREFKSSETSAQFKLDTLQQQLTLAQSESSRLTIELSTKSEEFIKYRRSKQSELLSLQASLDDLSAKEQAAQNSLKALQTVHLNQSRDLNQALGKIQDLTGRLAEQESTYASEARTLKRLVKVLEERESQAKGIVEGIEAQWAEMTEQNEKKQQEVERERRKRQEVEAKLDQLEVVLEKMGRGELPTPAEDGMMGLSPTVAIASRTQKSGKTFTEVYAEYVRLQDELATKNKEYDHMERTLTAVLKQVEERAPILSQQRMEYERVKVEASQLATQLSQALLERDREKGSARDFSGKYEKAKRENEVLQQQLIDLGRQVQTLLREVGRRDDPSIPVNDADLEHVLVADNVEAVITNNLVVFKSIPQLQEQNQKLLQITRELGKKMESEERDYREALEKEQLEAIQEAHEAMKELGDKLERERALVKAYMKERDLLKDAVVRRQASQPMQSQELVLTNGKDKELAEIQSQFEAYRTEMGLDSTRAREELITAQREVGSLSASLAKANARIEYLSERHRLSLEAQQLQSADLESLTSRNRQLFDQWTRLDVECARLSEDLAVANGRIEGLRSECAGLKAERSVVDAIQTRLTEENKSLALERSHLADLIKNVQKMHEELDRTGENEKKRLESEVEGMRVQMADLRNQLGQERDSLRHLTLQKDLEVKDFQRRLDRANAELAKTRESLISAETSKTHLEERITDLTKRVRGNEERLGVYEHSGESGSGEEELAQLRAALKMTEVDLSAARQHVEQFKEIAKANEDALAVLQDTYEKYKIEVEGKVRGYEAEKKALEERIALTQEELAKVQEEKKTWASEKKTLEGTIFDLTTSERNWEGQRTETVEEVKKAEERIKAAEQRYSNEVLAHAESIKQLEGLKTQLQDAQTAIREQRTLAESASAKLTASEDSWKAQREALDKEIGDLNKRCQDLNSQNAILHQHLESVSSQAARIKQAAETPAGADGENVTGSGEDDSESKLAELRSVVSYLRREKEVAELQLELSKQETVRLKASVEHLSQTLNETRETLAEEREKAVQNAANATQHAELLERINQLNILRESNATLRADSEANARKAKELGGKLKEVMARLQPAEEEARVSKAECEAMKKNMEKLEEECRRWQERNAQLLTKYDRIDPAEVQALKDEIEQLKETKAKLESLVAERELTAAAQTERISQIERSLTNMRETGRKNNEIFQRRTVQAKEEIETAKKEAAELLAKVAALEEEKRQLLEAKAALEALPERSQPADAEPPKVVADAELSAKLAVLESERDSLLAEKASWVERAAVAAPEGATALGDEALKQAWEAEKTELVKSRNEAVAQAQAAQQQATAVSQALATRKQQFEALQNNFRKLSHERNAERDKAAKDQDAAVAAAIEKTKNELQAGGTSAETSQVDSSKHEEVLRALQEKHKRELEQAVSVARKEASAPVPVDVESALAKAKADFEEQLTKEKEEAMEMGRKEAGAKAKIKDQQLVRVQGQLKALEKQVDEWKKAGFIAGASAPTATGSNLVAAPSSSAVAQPKTTTTAATAQAPAQTAPPTTSPATATTSSQAKSPLSNKPLTGGVGVGRGRGVAADRARGNRALPQGGRGRGSPAAAAAANATNAATTGDANLSIVGAAAQKRQREESADGGEAQAKRQKAATPVTLNRPKSGAQ